MSVAFLILVGFGSVWLALGALTMPTHRAVRAATCLGVIVCAALLLAAAPTSVARAAAESDRWWAGVKNPFIAVNIAQYFAIAAVVIAGRRQRRPDLILPGISAVVGIHFLFLAQILGYPSYYLTGAAMVLADAASLALPRLWRPSAASLASGVILWASALLIRT